MLERLRGDIERRYKRLPKRLAGSSEAPLTLSDRAWQ
jgi:hypothetical protein